LSRLSKALSRAVIGSRLYLKHVSSQSPRSSLVINVYLTR